MLNSCRLCLVGSRNSKHMTNLFTSDLRYSDLSLIDFLYWVLSVEVFIEDSHSKLICQHCLQIIKYVAKLRETFRNNQLILEEKRSKPARKQDKPAKLQTNKEGASKVSLTETTCEDLLKSTFPVIKLRRLENDTTTTDYEKIDDIRYKKKSSINQEGASKVSGDETHLFKNKFPVLKLSRLEYDPSFADYEKIDDIRYKKKSAVKQGENKNKNEEAAAAAAEYFAMRKDKFGFFPPTILQLEQIYITYRKVNNNACEQKSTREDPESLRKRRLEEYKHNFYCMPTSALQDLIKERNVAVSRGVEEAFSDTEGSTDNQEILQCENAEIYGDSGQNDATISVKQRKKRKLKFSSGKEGLNHEAKEIKSSSNANTDKKGHSFINGITERWAHIRKLLRLGNSSKQNLVCNLVQRTSRKRKRKTTLGSQKETCGKSKLAQTKIERKRRKNILRNSKFLTPTSYNKNLKSEEKRNRRHPGRCRRLKFNQADKRPLSQSLKRGKRTKLKGNKKLDVDYFNFQSTKLSEREEPEEVIDMNNMENEQSENDNTGSFIQKINVQDKLNICLNEDSDEVLLNASGKICEPGGIETDKLTTNLLRPFTTVESATSVANLHLNGVDSNTTCFPMIHTNNSGCDQHTIRSKGSPQTISNNDTKSSTPSKSSLNSLSNSIMCELVDEHEACDDCPSNGNEDQSNDWSPRENEMFVNLRSEIGECLIIDGKSARFIQGEIGDIDCPSNGNEDQSNDWSPRENEMFVNLRSEIGECLIIDGKSARFIQGEIGDINERS